MALIGASGTVEWSGDLTGGSISMFCQFRTPADFSGAGLGVDLIKLTNSTDDISLRYWYYDASTNILQVRIKVGGSTLYYGLETRGLTALTWYDVGFGFDAHHNNLYLYVKASDLTEPTELFEGSTNLADYMDVFEAIAVAPLTAWTGIELLSETAEDSLNTDDDIYLQNPMVMNGAMTAFDFNTLRRLCFMWNNKTEVYPK